MERIDLDMGLSLKYILYGRQQQQKIDAKKKINGGLI
jgi:hypothetical protein